MPFLRDPHEAGEAEVNLRLEGGVAFNLGERLAIEVDRFTRADDLRHGVG